MCYEYYQRLQRLEDERKRELLEQQKQAQRDRDRILQERPEWKAPEEPVRIREKVPV